MSIANKVIVEKVEAKEKTGQKIPDKMVVLHVKMKKRSNLSEAETPSRVLAWNWWSMQEQRRLLGEEDEGDR